MPREALDKPHSQKTLVKKLQSHGVLHSDKTVAGNTSTRRLDTYNEGNENQQRKLSNIINEY